VPSEFTAVDAST